MLKKLAVQFLILALLFVVSIAAGCGSDQKDATAAGGVDRGNGAAGRTVGSTRGDMAPDFTLKRIDGGDLTLSELRGKAVIVDFWDTWCPPCRKALPHLQELSETYGNDLVVVGVAFGREGEAKVRSFVKQRGLTFEMVIYDPASSILADYGGIQSIPTTFLLDPQGVIVRKWVGGAPKSSYESAVVGVLGDKNRAG